VIDDRFVLLAASLNLVGSSTYAWSTLKGHTKPNRVTWAIWAAAPLIAFAAQIGQGVGLSSLMTFMVGFGPLTVLLASFLNKDAYWEIKTLDIVCGVLSLIGLGLWGITRVGNLAIIFAILADALAGIPTVIKSWIAPETENYSVFLFGTISAVITMLTLKEWSFEQYAFPLYIFAICFLLFLLIKFKVGTKKAA
jgi:hypothetical protein